MPLMLKNEIIIYNQNKLIIEPSAYTNLEEDITIDEIIKSGCLILGPAGTGKSYKIKQIFKKLDELNKKYIK